MGGFGRRVQDPRVLLQVLLPEARRLAEGQEGAVKGQTALWEAAAPYYRDDNLKGVHVYLMPGGWCADVQFAEVPPGISNVLGTPVEQPLESEAHAMEQAKSLLAMIVVASRAPPLPGIGPVFLFHGYKIPIHQDLMDTIAGLPVGDNRDYVLGRLADVDAMLTPLSTDRMNGMSPDERKSLFVVSAMALAQGILRWPQRELKDGKLKGGPDEPDGRVPKATERSGPWTK